MMKIDTNIDTNVTTYKERFINYVYYAYHRPVLFMKSISV